MYLAFETINAQPAYILRESSMVDSRLTHRDLFDLGPDPSVFIKYIGSRAFYFDEAIETAIKPIKPDFDSDELEDIFWPWIRPDIRRSVETFKKRESSFYKGKKLDPGLRRKIDTQVHPFDKRRIHFLKFGAMDQGPVENMPPKLFKDLPGWSRDEIEQRLMRQEAVLKARDLKSYVYTVFDLQRFFKSFLAKKMPHALDQEKVDAFFIKEFCRLNKRLFDRQDQPHRYMTRYLFMFFDHLYANTTLLDDFAREFMNRHRFYAPPKPENPVSDDQALKLFEISAKQLRTMTKTQLTRRYREIARSAHPDAGGSDEKFVALNNAFHRLLEKIRPGR